MLHSLPERFFEWFTKHFRVEEQNPHNGRKNFPGKNSHNTRKILATTEKFPQLKKNSHDTRKVLTAKENLPLQKKNSHRKRKIFTTKQNQNSDWEKSQKQ